jgi:tetratricopeptide (TPR) repeat protein
MVMSNLATAYYSLAHFSNKEKNLVTAIDMYRGALKAYTIKENPVEYSTINMYLGAAYQALAEIRPMRGNLTLAVKAYNKALKISRSKGHPLYYNKVKSHSVTTIYKVETLHQ